MDPHDWLSQVDDLIDARPNPADRAWAWCWAVRTLAVADLRAAPTGTTTDAVWVEPQMAWAMDDLADAGAHARPPVLPAFDPVDLRALIPAALRRLIVIADGEDPRMPVPLVEACAYAVRRAALAHHACAGALP